METREPSFRNEGYGSIAAVAASGSLGTKEGPR